MNITQVQRTYYNGRKVTRFSLYSPTGRFIKYKMVHGWFKTQRGVESAIAKGDTYNV